MKLHPNNKTILLHCHIFKNGGSTIDSALTKNFGERALVFENSSGQQFLRTNSIIEFIKNSGQREIASISSHGMGLPSPRYNSIQFIPLIMIREPLDRLGSMYSFYRRHKNSISHECLLAKRETLKSFVDTLCQSGLDTSFSNLQCQFFLANYFPPKHPSNSTWPTIVENLNSTPCVGLLEMFDESMVLWEECLRPFIATIDLSYQKKNVSKSRSSDLDRRLETIHEQLGDNLVAEFKRRNEYDYRLYELIKKRLLVSTTKIPTFEEHLANFRKRMPPEAEQIPEAITQETSSEAQLGGDIPPLPLTTVFTGKKQISLSRPPSEPIGASCGINIIGCGLFNQETGDELHIVHHGQRVEVIIAIEANKPIEKPIVGITVTDDNQSIVFSMNSLYTSVCIHSIKERGKKIYSFLFTIPPLNSGSYTITPAFASGTQEEHTMLSTATDAILFFIPRMIKQRMPGFLYLNDYQVTTNS